MSHQLGTLEELPLDYRNTLTDLNLVPLWPALRSFLPYGKPTRACEPMLWRYEDVRPLLMQAGDLTPIEKAERRVLILANPSLDPATARATPTIYLGLQLINPGETAPNHRHSPSAIRFVVEGEGGFTMVEGERLPMEKGDLILTPSGLWHEHGHTGSGPVVWLDALDLPLVYSVEASYCIEGEDQARNNRADSSQATYRRSGLQPYAALDRPVDNYPLRRYPWREVKAALMDMASHAGPNDVLHLAYVNPETGRECLPILGFSALALRPGETYSPKRRSASQVLHVIEGEGDAVIDGVEMRWGESSTMAVPTHAEIQVRNNSSTKMAFLFVVDDAPMQRKLGFYEEF
jgi:gentisate 1,2-dioxygenase